MHFEWLGEIFLESHIKRHKIEYCYSVWSGKSLVFCAQKNIGISLVEYS